MFQILLLICAIEISRPDCTTANALDVIRGPEVPNQMMCGFHGQAFIASTAMAPRSGREYLKIQCVRISEGREARQEPKGAPRADEEQSLDSTAQD